MLVGGIVDEMVLRNEYLENRKVSTIYFGGGTPSMLKTSAIGLILNEIYRNFDVDNDAEVTLEANPEDLNPQKLAELRSLGINRLSMGTQSFLAHELLWMNRMHTPEHAIRAVVDAQEAGFDNISIDLIFGLPEQTLVHWEQNLNSALKLNIQHISSYGLTVEQRTKLHHDLSKGKQLMPDENLAEACFRMNMQVLPDNGFEHYEISNFARPNNISRHNSSYWQGANYLGLGPSAHSYNGRSRQWNVRSNAAYIRSVAEERPMFEIELLSSSDRVNEHIMTGLRCKWGVQRSVLDSLDLTAWKRIVALTPSLGSQFFQIDEERIVLTADGRLMADRLASSLFQDI